ERLESNDNITFEPERLLISFNNSAIHLFGAGDSMTKRLVVTAAGSNLTLYEGKLNIDAQKPFRRWAKTPTTSTLRRWMREVRTFVLQKDKETIDLTARITKIFGQG